MQQPLVQAPALREPETNARVPLQLADRRWRVHAVTPERLTFPLEKHDPAEMMAKMVDVIDRDDGAFRNLLPQSSEAFVRAEQARAWGQQ